MEVELDSLINQLKKIGQMGFVATHRKGDTGPGKTLEDLLGIKENNLKIPDWGGLYELKTQRIKSKSRVTLFTMSPKLPEGESWQSFIEKYGYIDSKNRIALKKTMYFNPKEPTNGGWSLSISEKQILLKVDNNIVAFWTKENIMNKLLSKLNNTVFVYVETKKINNIEHFHFVEAILASDIDWDNFLSMLQNNEIVIELRMHQKPTGAVRDHGTAFRIRLDLIKNLYSTVKPLLITNNKQKSLFEYD